MHCMAASETANLSPGKESFRIFDSIRKKSLVKKEKKRKQQQQQQ